MSVTAEQPTTHGRGSTRNDSGRRALTAQHDASICADCGRTLDPDERVWRYRGKANLCAPHCDDCRPVEMWKHGRTAPGTLGQPVSLTDWAGAAVPCDNCERPVVNYDRGERVHTFCCERCRRTEQTHQRAVRHEPHTCHTCGTLYRPTRTDGRYCSNACRQRAYRARNA